MVGRGMACHARPCGETAEDGGGADVIDVEGEDDPPPPPRPQSGKPPPMEGKPSPPLPKAPRTATPVERAELAEQVQLAAGRGQIGAVHEWVEQHAQLQRTGAWVARGISAEAANHTSRFACRRANEDKRAAEWWLADVTKEPDRLVVRAKTVERDPGTAHKATGHRQSHCHRQGWGLRVPRPPRVRVRGGGAVPLVSATLWPTHRPGMPRRRHAPARCGQCPPASGWPRWPLASRPMWTPWPPTPPGFVPHWRMCAGSTLPTASSQRPWTPSPLRRWWSRALTAPLPGALPQGGGGSSSFNFGPRVSSAALLTFGVPPPHFTKFSSALFVF